MSRGKNIRTMRSKAQHNVNVFTNYGKNAAIKAWEKLMYPNQRERTGDSPKSSASVANLDWSSPVVRLMRRFYS